MVEWAMKIFNHACPSGKWPLKSACPTGKSTSPRLLDTVFFLALNGTSSLQGSKLQPTKHLWQSQNCDNNLPKYHLQTGHAPNFFLNFQPCTGLNLEMSTDVLFFCTLSGPQLVYELTAVLIHHGPTAYSGHYVAHIKDRKVSCSKCCWMYCNNYIPWCVIGLFMGYDYYSTSSSNIC